MTGSHDDLFKTGGGMVAFHKLCEDRPDGLLGCELGGYRITGLIAEGGMGRVYQADRVDGIFDRKVAIKISPASSLSPELRERFLREQSILAGLNHPNISQLYDAGVTDDGLPYFVMDYVEGLPIDEYCDSKGLGIRDRLALVLDVARAIQFAHRNLVVHRDIKPSNVFVDESGRVRVLDFGIAKMLHPDAPSANLTQESRRPATPAFASPEMLCGEPVNATTDVYSIGALLYLLLTGKLPLDFEDLSLSKLLRRAQDTIPKPISHFDPNLAGDVDAIVAKALAKSPEERYESVESLATDISNYLEGLPVTARAPSSVYRASKFVRRHRSGVAFSAFAAIALVVIAVLSVRSAIESDRQAQQIALERDRAETTKSFLISIFNAADPNIIPGEQTARQILEAGRLRIENELAEQPEVQVDLLRAMGGVYQNWRMGSEGRSVMEKELELRESVDGPESEQYASTLIHLAFITDIAGDYDSSIDYARRALYSYRALGDSVGEGLSLERIGRVQHLRGNYAEARQSFERGLELVTEHAGAEAIEASMILEHLANLSNHQGRYDESLSQFEEVLRVRSKYISGDHSEISSIYLGMGSVLVMLRRFDEARETLKNGLAMNERLFGVDNSYRMYFVNGLGKVSEGSGDLEAAASWYEETRRLAERDMPGSANLAFASSSVARVNMMRGDFESALKPFTTAMQIFEEKLPSHWALGDVKWRLGLCLAETGRAGEGESLILEGLEIIENQWGSDHQKTLDARAATTRFYEISRKTPHGT